MIYTPEQPMVEVLHRDIQSQISWSNIFVTGANLILTESAIIENKLEQKCILVAYLRYPVLCHIWVVIDRN